MIFMAGGRPDGHGGSTCISVTTARAYGPSPQISATKSIQAATSIRRRFHRTGKYFFWTSTRGFADKPLDSRLSFQELTKRLISPRNGLGDIYQIDIGVLSIGK